ncbi:hypothetical protein CTheo_7622 [Ceratobasidium theobromae]|uniref:lytic cellulose monooxygenase (C4-dehydrogenating) n=1 Tax=Ceratobasidium theobromae TaxID=1582974 RepID=A0A5N5QB96_9AGAM|nr:hypothetical protein CTheo_7622 [Ceratobasidium theobromae]
MLFTSLALVFAGVSSVRAHGYVQTVNIAGQTFQGWHPFEDPYASPVPTTVMRKVADDGPITFDSPDLTCNKGGSTGNGVTATIAAGQAVTWTMNRWPDDHKGPVSVYMANCGGDCDSFNGSGNVWFKLSSQGLIDAASFQWASDKLIADGLTWSATVPSNIKAGKYLMRLELLALHSAGAPQLYPFCTQLDVTGGGNGAPTSSELVSIPGVYTQSDQGLFGNIWSQPTSWPQVGPNVAAFVSGGSSGGSDPAPVSSSPATSNAAPTSSEPATTVASPTKSANPITSPSAITATAKPRKTCRVKKPKATNKHAKREYMRPWGKRRI